MSIITSKNNSELGKYGIKEYDDENLSWEEFKEKFEWVLKGKKKEADIYISKWRKDHLIWRNGLWEDGLWEDGLWEKGIWERGTWEFGTWKNGTWENGIWQIGVWLNGTWKNGIWEGGDWYNGDWYNGVWLNGYWKGGSWLKGIWGKGKIIIDDKKSFFKNGIFFDINFHRNNSFDKFFNQVFSECIIFNIDFKKEDSITYNIYNSIILDEGFLKYSNIFKYKTKLK